jgi:hypothetical protein
MPWGQNNLHINNLDKVLNNLHFNILDKVFGTKLSREHFSCVQNVYYII